MPKPVQNWMVQVGDTPVFYDIVDDGLRHYGPRPIWRALSRRDLGQKKSIFTGTIDLGYDQPELQALAASLAGKRIAPLAISGLKEEPRLGIPLPPPHIGTLMPLNSLPFPQYRLSVTVDLQAPDAASLIRAIENGWTAETLLEGKFIGSADAVSARAGYKVRIDAKSCAVDIAGRENQTTFLTVDAWRAIQGAVERNSQSWTEYFGASEQPGERAAASSALVEILFGRCFEERKLVVYDNGIAPAVFTLRDTLTFGDAELRVFVASTATKIVFETLF
jgi:hypothetical protein